MNVLGLMEIGSRVKNIRISKGLSQETLAERLGKDQSYVSRFEGNEFLDPQKSTIERFAKALGVPVSTILQDADKKLSKSIDSLEKLENFNQIPLLSGTVSASTFTLAFNDWGSDMIYVPMGDVRNKVAWKIQGKSMEPRYLDGDIVIIDNGIQFKNGDDVIAENHNGVTIKNLKILADGTVELRPWNQDFPTVHLPKSDEVTILGVVVLFIRDPRKTRK